MSKGERTRARILDLAYDSIVRKGFAATSIDELVAGAEITKSGFFYHFQDKHHLARELVKRYGDEDDVLMDDMEARARELHDDPLHALLIFLKLYAEMLERVLKDHPGCLVATITYQDAAFDPEVRRMNREGIEKWRRRYTAWFEEILARHEPRVPMTATDLADQVCAVTYGSIVLSKGVENPSLLSRQPLVGRDMIRALFGV